MYARHSARKSFQPLCGISAARLNPKGVERKSHFIGAKVLGKRFNNKLSVILLKVMIVIVIHKIFTVLFKRLCHGLINTDKVIIMQTVLFLVKAEPA